MKILYLLFLVLGLTTGIAQDSLKIVDFRQRKYYFQNYATRQLMVDAMVKENGLNKFDHNGRKTGWWVEAPNSSCTIIIGEYKALVSYPPVLSEWEKSDPGHVDRPDGRKNGSLRERKRAYRKEHGIFNTIFHKPKESKRVGEWKYYQCDGRTHNVWYNKNGKYIKSAYAK